MLPAGVTTTAPAGACDVRLAGKRARRAAFYGPDLLQSGQGFTGWAGRAVSQVTSPETKLVLLS